MQAQAMAPRTGRLAAAAAAASVLALAVAVLADAQGGYPIWWSPQLDLEALEHIEAELKIPFPGWTEIIVTNPSIRPILKLDERRGYWLTNQAMARTCRALIDLTEQGYIRGDYDLLTGLGPRCYALEALRTARPARVSYLRDFVFDEGAIRFLPAMLGPRGDCEYLMVILEANRQGGRWESLPNHDPSYRVGRVEVRDRDTLIVRGRHVDGESRWVSTIEIYGRGDFNGDGLDDLLVKTDVDEGFASWGPRLFLMIRTGPKETVRVAWEYGILPTRYSGCRYGGYDLAIPNQEPFAGHD